MAIINAVIGGGKVRVGTQLAGKQATGQGHTHDNTHLAFASRREELLLRLEAEHVEDNLHALHMRILNSLERLPDGFDADAIITNLALLYQLVHDGEDFRHVINR